ncbi:PAP2 domain protein [Aspergillus glaucus CBS 516.65]|uniref:Phosphatidic acid phosphatase type 2/haloperoxidase domain-containing protein n=1 Tax=Aspergillus glaucus CBS 516.65 TaxID=1160497 RepID=A0A1L9V948_ASPGL|nr:hypothetical protein ASPGLDRAFT_134991 [Aspergillus glaucus CBS 516.65]OJJ80423.1 hypothetical protein ASPGLDRAFT_134991 [Aspergillus glaucus CBS 516.65]
MAQGTNGQPDAGLRSLDHYRYQLPSWRYWPRQKLLPLVRYETPYLAWFQERVRTPSLDSYFAFTANLGTHTFFMIFLPILIWSGQITMGRGLVHMLASGVFFSGFVKDLLCLPRPLSPPLQRITMSGSAALEYGFPSTHSTNAVSVAVYCLGLLNSPESTLGPRLNLALQALTWVYVASVVLGRLYCGMHGFFDVIIGCLLGALIGFIQFAYEPFFEESLASATGLQVLLLVLVILALVRIHPEPADDCPCFDDSVAFAGVMLGIEVAYWHSARSGILWADPSYEYEDSGSIKTVLRMILGVVLIFAWKEIMKPFLLRILPPVFRGLEKLGLILPRRFFTNASQYSTVPAQLTDDEVLPNFSEIPSILTNISQARRRAVSVGPQSEADAYETLAYREKRRRESRSGGNRPSPVLEEADSRHGVSAAVDGRQPSLARRATKLNDYENMMGTGTPRYNSPHDPGTDGDRTDRSSPPVPFPPYEEPPDEAEMFRQIKRPRVRYDVEVITKLIVYSGIAALAVEGAPLVFELVGLGMVKAK